MCLLCSLSLQAEGVTSPHFKMLKPCPGGVGGYGLGLTWRLWLPEVHCCSRTQRAKSVLRPTSRGGSRLMPDHLLAPADPASLLSHTQLSSVKTSAAFMDSLIICRVHCTCKRLIYWADCSRSEQIDKGCKRFSWWSPSFPWSAQ